MLHARADRRCPPPHYRQLGTTRQQLPKVAANWSGGMRAGVSGGAVTAAEHVIAPRPSFRKPGGSARSDTGMTLLTIGRLHNRAASALAVNVDKKR
jgi:chorismate synthase